MCSSSCLCDCCNSEIDTIYPIRSLAFYLLQNIKNATTKKTHWAYSSRQAMEQSSSSSERRNRISQKWDQEKRQNYLLQRQRIEKSESLNQSWTEEKDCQEIIFSRETLLKKEERINSEKVCKQTFEMKSKRSPWYDEKMILRLSNCFQILNIKKECCEIHQETQFQIDFFLFLQK